MPFAVQPIGPGARVIRIDSGDFRALTVTFADDRYVVSVDPDLGGECAGPAAGFVAVPDDWPNPPPLHISEIRAVEAAYSGPIPAAAIAAAEARDAALPALTRRLDAAEDWLGWVEAHLYPLSPRLFEPQLLAARSAREAALRDWLGAGGRRLPEQPASDAPAWAAE